MKIKLKIQKEKKIPRGAKYCIRCGKKILDPNQLKFCDIKCRTRYHSLKRYNQFKDDPDYKSMKKKYHREWRNRNKLKFREMMREPSRRYQEKMRKEQKMKKGGSVK